MPELPSFPLGVLLVTRAALDALEPGDVAEALTRHAFGDWGEICRDDAEDNDRALVVGDRLFSAYAGKGGKTFFVITEADRSATTVLLPDDY